MLPVSRNDQHFNQQPLTDGELCSDAADSQADSGLLAFDLRSPSSPTMHQCAGSHALDRERGTDQRRSDSGDVPQESKQALGSLKDKSGPMRGFHCCCVCCSTHSPGFCRIFSVSAQRNPPSEDNSRTTSLCISLPTHHFTGHNITHSPPLSSGSCFLENHHTGIWRWRCVKPPRMPVSYSGYR